MKYSELSANFNKELTFSRATLNWSFPVQLPKINPEHSIYESSIFSEANFNKPSGPIFLSSLELEFPTEEFYVLRIPLRHKYKWAVPTDFGFLSEFISYCESYQSSSFGTTGFPFVYLTIRHGPQKDYGTDIWHVDGFQGNPKLRHSSEISYIWVDAPEGGTTEWAVQSFDIPKDFDPLTHNFFNILAPQVDPKFVISSPPKTIAVFNSYAVHRKPNLPGNRSMIRLTFSPVEIKDPNFTPNPNFKLSYDKSEPRDSLK